MTTERIAELEAALARIEHLEALSIIQENLPVPALQRRIAELEAALEGQKQKMAILDNMVKERDREIATVTSERDRYRKALDWIAGIEDCGCGVPCDCHSWYSLVMIAREAREGKGDA